MPNKIGARGGKGPTVTSVLGHFTHTFFIGILSFCCDKMSFSCEK